MVSRVLLVLCLLLCIREVLANAAETQLQSA